MVYQKNADSLILQIKCTSAYMHSIITEKIHEHSEYDTEWSRKISDWHGSGVFKHVKISTYKGNEHIIYEIEFMFCVYTASFIDELNSYFSLSGYQSQYISHVKFGTIKTFLDE